MCGIAGIYNLNGIAIDAEALKVFTDSMTHRGPDGSGYEIVNNSCLGLGHRRLSILDLSEAGHQPFYYMNRYCMVYNGEVFNFNDIKHELLKKGYKFISDTDTEVVMAAYDCYGLKCFDYFNGMWALALWDEKEKKLILSRDRFGVKPLYYSSISNETFAFASETRSFKFLKSFKRIINADNYNITLRNNYALEGLGYTIFNNIYQLLPGHFMEIKFNEPPTQKRWYHIQERIQPITMSEEAQLKHFIVLFRDACRIRLISDVALATALSGGLDSSSIYSTVFDILKSEKHERTSKDSQLAVSAIFPGLENDEKEYVELALEFTKGKIKWILTDNSNLGEDIERETELFDAISSTPVTAISAIYKGMKKEGITVSLDGHGVDEMLFGYLYMVYDLWLLALKEQDKSRANEYAEILAGLYHPKHQKEQLKIFKKANLKNITLLNLVKLKIKNVLGKFSDSSMQYLPVSLPSLSDKPYNFELLPIPERMLYFEFFQNSLPSLLRNFDRAGMMNSVEIRMPFLDYRLVEFIFSLPMESKIGGGFTKKILRQVMKKRMNESIRCRTFKVGIGSPFQYWADNNLKSWLYQKVDLLDKSENVKYKLILDDYYKNHILTNLEAVWYRINMKLIE